MAQPVEWLALGLSERGLIPVRSREFSGYTTPRPQLAPIQQPFSAEVNPSKDEIIVNNIKSPFVLHSEHTASSLEGTTY